MNKQQIIEEYEKHRAKKLPDTLQSILDRYALYQDPERPYHNANHARSVLAFFEVLYKLSDVKLSSKTLNAMRLAIAYHDIRHQGVPDDVVGEDGLTNVQRAQAVVQGDLKDEDEAFTQQVLTLIAGTQYPHEEIETTGELEVALRLIRDADMLWGLVPDNYEVTLLGIWLEQTQSGHLPTQPCDVEKLLVQQIKFIQAYAPYTKAGAVVKGALFDQATVGWSMVALEFLRQMEVAQVVSDMADDEVLKLRGAMKDVLKDETRH